MAKLQLLWITSLKLALMGKPSTVLRRYYDQRKAYQRQTKFCREKEHMSLGALCLFFVSFWRSFLATITIVLFKVSAFSQLLAALKHCTGRFGSSKEYRWAFIQATQNRNTLISPTFPLMSSVVDSSPTHLGKESIHPSAAYLVFHPLQSTARWKMNVSEQGLLKRLN